ncbi:MAG TPA: SDR family oxidoreductase [Acidimicrobiia bacterium]|nr:SDR family oxidoreductase [Acidimicrobiia bacterium]
MGILEGRRIVLTGGASGMGAASVRAFAREGARVFSMDVNGDAGAQVASEAAELGGDVLFEQCNVASERLDDVMERGIEWLGGLDVLANVAGIERGATPQDVTEEQFEEILDPNLWATIRTNQLACPHMQEAGGGRIINYASDAGLGGMPMAPAYSVSKGGVLGWSRSIAREWGVYNIAVAAMCPAIWTPMYEEYRRREPPELVALSDRMLEGTDADRDMGPVMVFLASTGANAVSGQHFHVGKINVAF